MAALPDKLDDHEFELLVREAESELGSFVASEGPAQFEHPALVATARKA